MPAAPDETVTLRPSQDEFESLASRGNLIPVVREIVADMDTPLSLFRRLDDGRTAFLLESVEGGEKWAPRIQREIEDSPSFPGL